MDSRHKRWFAISILVCLLCCVMPVKAAGQIVLDIPVSITIHYTESEAEFALYKVADVSEEVYFTPTANFAMYPVEMNGLDADGWRVLAETLHVYVNRDNINVTAEAVVEEDGKAVFQDLETGLYLVIGKPADDSEGNFVPTPFLISLPSQLDDGTWNYQPEVNAKVKSEDSHMPDYMKKRVIKNWKDEGNEKYRPSKIEVELLMDGEILETVELNEENNWTYTWSELESGHEWQVVEKRVPDQYTVTIKQENNTFIITNKTTREKPADDHMIPQTGQLWWPIPILAMTGLVCLLVGWVRRKTLGDINEK